MKIKFIKITILFIITTFNIQGKDQPIQEIGKKRIILLRPTYSLLFSDFITPGTNIEIGFEQNKMCFGLSVEMNEATRKTEYGGGFNREEAFLIGVSLQCGYNNLFRSKWFKVSPKLSIGIWGYSKTSTIENSDGKFWSNNGIKKHKYYVAPMISTDIGYKHLFLYLDNSLLIGNDVAFRLNIGITIKI